MYSDIVSSDELWAYINDTVICESARVSVCTESIQGNAYSVFSQMCEQCCVYMSVQWNVQVNIYRNE